MSMTTTWHIPSDGQGVGDRIVQLTRVWSPRGQKKLLKSTNMGPAECRYPSISIYSLHPDQETSGGWPQIWRGFSRQNESRAFQDPQHQPDAPCKSNVNLNTSQQTTARCQFHIQDLYPSYDYNGIIVPNLWQTWWVELFRCELSPAYLPRVQSLYVTVDLKSRAVLR